MKMVVKVAAVVVAYHPDSSIIENINSYLQAVDKIYIYRNSILGSNLELDLGEKLNKKLEWLGSGKNVGIAEALNLAGKKAYDDGFSWLLTMDQDSKFYLPDSIKKTLNHSVALYYPVCRLSSELIDQQTEPWILTSGNIVNLESWKNVGGYRSELFIDGVDFDFCIRLMNNNEKFIRLNKEYELHHVLGEGVVQKKYLFFKCRITNHHPLRLFYIFRNYFFISRSIFFRHPRWSLFIFWVLLIRLVKIPLSDTDRIESFRMAFQGFISALRGQMGEYKRM